KGLSKSVVSVKPMLQNDLPAGYVVDAVRASPSNIEIAGDEKLIESIHTIETEKISLKDKDKTFTVPVNLVVPEGITVTNSEVSVNIVINKKE
ncbi:MAG: YbbR-like domain-containing protein, partial [Selenomonadaceae bacterium]|nr:YbbR-like domain-containing protein [Selenomonadaceae bacterium]